jgi:putative oxidoreductase
MVLAGSRGATWDALRILFRSDQIRFGLVPFIARLLLIAEFVLAANGKASAWSSQAEYMAAHGMRMIGPLLGAALVIEVVGSLSLLTGYRAREAAAVMFGYLGIVSVRLHDFWDQSGNAAGMNQTQFFKNLGIMGGLLMVAAYGPGLWSFGRRLERVEKSRPAGSPDDPGTRRP